MEPLHASDGGDERGLDLEIIIRIGADGRVYFHDITPDLLPTLLALCPTDQTIRRRIAAAAAFAPEEEQ